MTTTQNRRWAPLPRTTAPVDRTAYAAAMVVGEVKPHTPGGISAGISQLRRRRDELKRAGHDVTKVTFNLITYRPAGTDPTQYQLSISDPGQMRTAVLSNGPVPGFKLMGAPFTFAAATRKIDLRDCPSTFGTEIEKAIRARYGGWMRSYQGHAGFRVPRKPRGGKGADLPFKQYELIAFLRELAAELEAELEAEFWGGPSREGY